MASVFDNLNMASWADPISGAGNDSLEARVFGDGLVSFIIREQRMDSTLNVAITTLSRPQAEELIQWLTAALKNRE